MWGIALDVALHIGFQLFGMESQLLQPNVLARVQGEHLPPPLPPPHLFHFSHRRSRRLFYFL